MKQPWYNRKWVVVAIHIASWLIVFSLPYLLSGHYDDNHHNVVDNESKNFFYLNSCTNLLLVAVFYFNAHVLTPGYIYKRRYLDYVLMIMLIFCGILLIHSLLFILFIKTKPFILARSAAYNIAPYLLTVAVSTTYQMIGNKIKTDKMVQERHEETLKTELSFLRSQISPHFMFNVLNNIVALARMQSEQLEPTVIKLSSLMRYMLYETKAEKASLKKEIEYLQSYISLQQQRFEDDIQVNFDIDVADDQYDIEPMLLIPFVENAFKHGIGLIEEPRIDIRLKTEKNILYFHVANKFNDLSDEIKDSASGIGLTNVKRRLDLLYGKDYSLQIDRSNGWFTITLQIKFH